MKKFIESHSYNEESVRLQKPLISGSLADNVDEITNNLISPFVNQPQQMEILIEASITIQFQLLTDALLCALMCGLYVGNT